MRCKMCDQRLADGISRCPACGTQIFDWDSQTYEDVTTQRDNSFDSQDSTEYSRDSITWNNRHPWEKTARVDRNQGMKMKWFKFLVYFSLIATCVANVYMGIESFTGLQYGDSEAIAMIYGIYEHLEIVDKIYGVLNILFGLFALYVRQQLAHYRRKGPDSIIALYVFGLLLSIIYMVMLTVATGIDMFTADNIVGLIISLGMILINKIYFDKRRHLFTE